MFYYLVTFLSINFFLFSLICLIIKKIKNKILFFFSIFIFFSQNIILLLFFIFYIINNNSFKFIFGKYLDNNLYFSFSNTGCLLIILSIFIGYICFLIILNKSKHLILFFNIIFQFIFINIVLFSFSNNILLFFIFYELLLLPSFIIIYFLSPNKRGIITSIYFLIWTQLGSILVLICILYIIFKYKITLFKDLFFLKLNIFDKYILSFLVFFGFGIKIPIWPFHFWLTKTHVEATTSFSIFLSGFLVKTALYGFFKFFIFFINNNLNYFYIIIISIGIIDSSLKFWVQVDLKKLVAYCTIQEMNIILLLFFLGYNNNIYIIFSFIITHTLLSTIFFYIVDLVYKRYNTRIIYNLKGLLVYTPKLSFYIILSILFYNGFPISLKFIVELFFLLNLFNSNYIIFNLIILSCNFFGAIGFSKLWFNILFGKNIYKKPLYDINILESLILFICFFFLVILIFIIIL